MDNSKYVDLISNASAAEFGENKPGSFTNRLSVPLTLDEDWEVGLVEIAYPKITGSVTPNGKVFIQGNNFTAFKETFKIDYSKAKPFEEAEKAAKKAAAKVTGSVKPELVKDVNGVYSIVIGNHNIPRDWEVETAISINENYLKYFGLPEKPFKETLVGKKFTEPVEYHHNIAPIRNLNDITYRITVIVSKSIPEVYFGLAILKSDSIEDIVKKLNTEIDKKWKETNLKELAKPIFRIGKDGRMIYKPGYKRTVSNEKVTLNFDEESSRLLGFVQSDMGKLEPIVAKFRPHTGVSHINYVYSDIVAEHHQGDVMSNSLRVLPIGSDKEMNHATFDPVIYYPVKRKQIDTISIKISDDMGREPEFSNGAVHTTLHLKKAKKLY